MVLVGCSPLSLGKGRRAGRAEACLWIDTVKELFECLVQPPPLPQNRSQDCSLEVVAATTFSEQRAT